MSIWVWVELVCANCSTTTAGRHVGAAIPKRRMIEEARRVGWVFTKDESFCSRACKLQYEEFDPSGPDLSSFRILSTGDSHDRS